MKITQAGWEILTQISKDGQEELKTIEQAARTCYKSEANPDDELAAAKLVLRLISNGHEAMLEHQSLSVRFICDRAVSHELVRHRMASFAQESQRYCNYSKDRFGGEITFVQPWWMDEEDDVGYHDWILACEAAENTYFKLLGYGYPPQKARIVLPNCTKTEIVVTANYREWRHIFRLRTAKDAHPDMQWLMNSLLYEVQKKIPVIFDDIPVRKMSQIRENA